MLEVVPGKESLAMGPAVLNAAEAVPEVGTVLESPKLTFREGIVVGNIGAAVCFGDAQVSQKKRDGFGAHNAAAIGVDTGLARRGVIFADGLFQETLGTVGAFALSRHPSGDGAAEDGQDDI